jgi:hypothetical protein
MDLSQALDNMKFDQRMRDFQFKHGMVTREEVEKHLASLVDRSADCENLTLEDKDDFAD